MCVCVCVCVCVLFRVDFFCRFKKTKIIDVCALERIRARACVYLLYLLAVMLTTFIIHAVLARAPRQRRSCVRPTASPLVHPSGSFSSCKS